MRRTKIRIVDLQICREPECNCGASARFNFNKGRDFDRLIKIIEANGFRFVDEWKR